MRLSISLALSLLAVVGAEQNEIREVHRDLGKSSSGKSQGSSKSRETAASDDTGISFDVGEAGGESVQTACTAEAVKTQTGYEQCLEMCDMARCCFLKKDMLDSCIEDVACTDYIQYCHILKTAEDPREGDSSDSGSSDESEIENLFKHLQGEDDSKILKTAAPEDLWMHCKTEEIATRQGYKECKRLCKPGKCCHSSKDNCWEGNEHICSTYRACESLEEKRGRFKLEDNSIKIEEQIDESKTLEEACSVDNVLANGVGREECYMKCEKAGALCCSKKGKHNCSKEQSKLCEEYAECDILVDSDTEIISEVCSAELIMQKGNGWRICKEACSLAECCHAPMYDASGESSNCYKEMKDFCDDYQWCEELEDEDIDTKDLYAEDIAPEEVTHTKSLEEMCALQNILSVHGYMECNGICSDYECCFNDDECHESISCEGKEHCELFFYVGAEMVLNACTEQNLQQTEGLELCQTICDAHECCIQDNCNFLHDSCAHYQMCENLSSPGAPSAGEEGLDDVADSSDDSNTREKKSSKDDGATEES